MWHLNTAEEQSLAWRLSSNRSTKANPARVFWFWFAMPQIRNLDSEEEQSLAWRLSSKLDTKALLFTGLHGALNLEPEHRRGAIPGLEAIIKPLSKGQP